MTKTRHRFEPKLNKKLLLRHVDYTVYAVNGLAVRNVAKPDEEFGNFATVDEFPDLIPKGEIWITVKIAEREGIFFIANALARFASQAAGATEKAYDDGLAAEQALRERVNRIAYRDGKPHERVPGELYLEEYTTLPDPQGPVTVWKINGNLARSYYKTDYNEGGHGYVYPWVPRLEIWIDDGADDREIPFIVCHEYLERRLMRDGGLEYDHAHEICSDVEFKLRKCEGISPLLMNRRRKLQKRDLPKLTREVVYDTVFNEYVGGGRSERRKGA